MTDSKPISPASIESGDLLRIFDTDGTLIGQAIVASNTPSVDDPRTFTLAVIGDPDHPDRGPNRIKAAHIADEAFMAALNHDGWTTWGQLVDRLGFPAKVVLAKARILIERRQILHGCSCGCSGGFHPAEGCEGC